MGVFTGLSACTEEEDKVICVRVVSLHSCLSQVSSGGCFSYALYVGALRLVVLLTHF